MNVKTTRQEQILKALEVNQCMTVHSFSQMFDVAEMTIRRDLRELVSKDYVLIINGVAMLNKNEDGTSIVKSYTLSDERGIMADAKQRIGAKAASLVQEGETIIIDTGTTTETIVPFLPNDPTLNIVCHNTNILLRLLVKNYEHIVFPGGFYHKNTEFFESPESVSLISRSCANKYFCSAAGVSTNGHITCIEQYEIATKQASLKSAVKAYLMCDSSKFGKIRPALFASIDEFSGIITNKEIDPSWVDYFVSHGLEYYLV